jgi:uracil-DNA glycosylase
MTIPRHRGSRRTASPDLADVVAAARACRLCADRLPLGPRPVLRVSTTARLLIVGQAPGARVHASGLPFDDPSGARLQRWLGVDRATFYDATRIAFLPSGLCFPGTAARGGDRPPEPVCAPTWHPRVRPLLTGVRLTLLVGMYAQAHYLAGRRAASLTETVRLWRSFLPAFWPVPHPSWRCNGWLKRNSWFEAEVVPSLQEHVREVLTAPLATRQSAAQP